MAALILFIIFFLCAVLKYPSLLLAPFKPFLPKQRQHTIKKGDVSKEEDDAAADDDDVIASIFSTFDGDKDGFITADELHVSLARLHLSVTREEVDGMMQRADTNGDGLIDVSEFRGLYEGLRSASTEQVGVEEVELREVFGVFDGDGDGEITVEELGLVLRGMGMKEGGREEECRDMIRRVDLDGDGKVSFQEFKRMMKIKNGKLF